MKTRRLAGRILLLFLMIGMTGLLIGARNSNSQITRVTSQLKQSVVTQLSSDYQQKGTATIFLHGYAGGASSTNQLIRRAGQAKAAQKALVVHVYKNGVMGFHGYWKKSLKNPMVQVVFDNNHATQQKQITWLHQVLIQLKSRFNVHAYNAVGHSLGSNDIINEALLYGHDQRTPKLKKVVTIAGPFDGLTGYVDANSAQAAHQSQVPSRQTRHFKAMVAHRDNFPRHVQLLNVVGDTNRGFNNDGYVGVASAQSVKYLLKGQLRSYRELFVTGNAGAHCTLNHNQRVANAMIQFLWH